MALDPLKFKIAIDKRDLQRDIEVARETLMKGLKDVPINVKIANLESLKQQLANLEIKVNAAGSGGGGSIAKEVKAFDDLKKAAEEAEQTLSKGKAFRNHKKNIEALDVAIMKLKASMEKLEQGKSGLTGVGKSTDAVSKRIADTQSRIAQLEELKKRSDLLTKSDALTTPKALGQYAAVWKEFSSFLSGNNNMATSIKSMLDNLNAVEKVFSRLSGMETHMKNLLSFANANGYENKTGNLVSRIEAFRAKWQGLDPSDQNAVRAMNLEYFKLAAAIRAANKEQEKFNKDTAKAMGHKVGDVQEAARLSKQASDARVELERLKMLLRDLEAESAKAKAKPFGLDTSKLDEQIRQLKIYMDVLKEFSNGKRTGNWKETWAPDYQIARIRAKDEVAQLKAQEDAMKKNASAAQTAAGAKQALTAEEQKLAHAIQQSIGQMNRQSQVLTDLKTMAMQYLSVYAGQQFLNNIIEIGGQLEMQRLSIGAILQDTAHAGDLFDKIKNLALQSPFGVVELDQYTKQLSAYGFKYNELYDMTKRLADISAGAGTDVSRLALALGHVRSEGALSGYTLRQFAMNNIPMIGKLSEKLSEMQGKIVSAAEVRKMVSKKEIDYKMVEDVIKDLTNEGGMFYNMQEVISGSVKAKWKNLRDAFDVMYGEMAESGVGGGLKDVAALLTKMAKNWKELGSVVLSVVTVFGGAKVVMMAYNALLGTQTKVVLGTIAAERQAEISRLRLAQSYRTLTAAEKATLMSTKLLRSADIATALTAKTLTGEQLAKAVAMGKVSKATALAAVRHSTLNDVEKESIRTTILHTQVLSKWGKAMYGLRGAVLATGAALKTLFANPVMWIMVLVGAITDLWQRNNEEMERAKELAGQLRERSTEGLKNVRTMMSNTDMSYKKDGRAVDVASVSGGEFSWKSASEIDSGAMMTAMEQWAEFINNYAATPNNILNEAWRDAAGNVRTLADQYERLAQSAAMVAQSQRDLAALADVTEYAMNATNSGWFGGAFNEDLVENINDYSKSTKDFNNALTKVVNSYSKSTKAGLAAAMADKKFAKAIEEANEVMMEKEGRNLTEEEMLKRLLEGQENYNEAMLAFKGAFNKGAISGEDYENVIGDDYAAMKGDEATMNEDMDAYINAMKDKIKGMGWDIEELTDSQKQAILTALADVVAKAGDSSEEIRNKLIKLMAEKFDIPVDVDVAEPVAKTSALQEDLNALVDGDWTIDIKAVSNFSDLITKIRQEYKSAQDYFNNVEPFMIKMGVKMENGMKPLTKEQRQQIIENYMKENPNGNKETVIMMLDEWDRLAAGMKNALDFSSATNIDVRDPNPGGKVLKVPKSKKSSTKKTGRTDDKEAKAWKERIRQIQTARKLYEEWEKKTSPEAALKKVQERFKDLIDPKDIKTLEAYEKALEAVKKQAESRKGKRKGKDEKADEVIRQVDEALGDIDMMKFERDSDRALSMMKKGVDDLTRRWDIFNNVLETTGDKALAMRLAQFNDYDKAFNSRTPADALLQHIGSDMMLPDLPNMIDWDKIMRLSDKGIEDYVKDWLGGSDYERYIEGITEGLKQWKKLQQDAIKGSIQAYSKLIGSAVDYGTEIKKNNAEYDEARKNLNILLELGKGKGGIDKAEYDEALRMAAAERDYKNSILSSQYLNLVNGANGLVRDEMLGAIDEAMARLEDKFNANLLTVQQYREEIEKLNKIRKDWEEHALFGENNPLTNFMQGGIGGLREFYHQRAENAYRSGNIEEGDKYTRYWENLDKLQNTLGDLAVVVELVTGTFEGMQQAATAMSNMLQALGHTGSANTWSDIADGIGAISSIFSPAGKLVQNAMSGNVGGLVSSAISAPFETITGPITAFAQLHDKRRERQIEELRKDVQKIDDTLNLIRSARGRSLGYDSGSYRRMMAEMYSPKKATSLFDVLDVYFENRTNRGMYEYYSRGGTEGSGYTQELDSLKKQRQDYLDMYDEELSKKDSSNDALEEYKVKMAELDEQIMFYAEDLANELWGMDLKSWADQIGDALMDAFENGTSAALAYKDAISNIMRGVVSEMLKVGIIQPMMEKLQARLFGENGAFDYNDPEASIGNVLAELGRFFGEDGEGAMMMTAAEEFLTGAEELLNENYGISMKTAKQSTQTSGIQSQATEESIGIVSGQLARIAQDVSVKRIFLTQLVTMQMPQVLDNMEVQRVATENQLQSVRAIERMMYDGAGAMYESIDRMSRKIDKAITPEGRMKIQ